MIFRQLDIFLAGEFLGYIFILLTRIN